MLKPVTGALESLSAVERDSVVPDGVEALAYLRREGRHAAATRPDLVLLDLNLGMVSLPPRA